MSVEFNRVMDGIARYIDKEIMPGMNDLQEIVARIAVGRILGNREAVKRLLSDNPIIKSLVIIDDDGMVDIEKILAELKAGISNKGSIKIEIPWFGKMTFVPEDVDKLHREISGGY
jgi:hypothetical protein